MERLATVAAIAAAAFFAMLVGVLVYRILTGAVRTSGLLTDARGRTSPIRIQLLVFTLVASVWLVAGLGDARAARRASLPSLPVELVVFVALSHLAYLGSKAYHAFFSAPPRRR